MTEPECRCGRIKVGMTVTECRNWNPDCAVHGVESDWYQSAEQQLVRAEDDRRLRDLQARAREARRLARVAARWDCCTCSHDGASDCEVHP